MTRLVPVLLAIGVFSVPLLASAEADIVQKKPANVTPEQERRMNEKYAKDKEIVRRYMEQHEHSLPKSSRGRETKAPAGPQVAASDANSETKPHKKAQHGKIIEVSGHHHRTQ